MSGVLLRIFLGLARRRGLACWSLGGLTIALRVLMLIWHPVPAPSVHDEFSYLLAADTFASGRLVNPTHPLWHSFETFNVLQIPAYASKYSPLPGLVLALGSLLGHPWIGVLLSAGILSCTLCWALQGWLSPGYALLGAGLGMLRLGVSGYWIDSYWGGNLAAIGGCLVIGSLPRLVRRPFRLTGAAFGLGSAILLNTRPFEGAILSVVATVWLLFKRSPRRNRTQALIYAALAMTAGVGFQAFYNWRVAGNPFVLPYLLHDWQYTPTTAFWILPAHTAPSYRHDVIRRFWTQTDYQQWSIARAYLGLPWFAYFKRLTDFLWGGWLAAVIPLATILRLPRAAKSAAVFLGAFLLITFVERAPLPHYFAPATTLFFLFTATGFRALLRQNLLGRGIAAGALILWSAQAIQPEIRPERGLYENPSFANDRAQLEQMLESKPGRHLVIVQYGASHVAHAEWVYNRAKIDDARIVWARYMEPGKNRQLLDYFHDRQIWLLRADDRPARLVPYTGLNPQH